MARAIRRPFARLFHRTVPARAVQGFGAALVVAGVALPWVVGVAGGWEAAADVEPVILEGEEPLEPTPMPTAAPGNEPASGTAVAAATAMRPALVHVAGGMFLRGSPSGEVGRYDESETQSRWSLSSFVMCETEVTQAQFVAVVGALPEGCGGSCGDALPAHSVSWFDAADYLDALSRKEALRPCYAGRQGDIPSWDMSCDGYRLPLEAEWEYAARAGTSSAYSFGDDSAQLSAHAWFAENSGGKPHPVGKLQPNPWRLFDMHGNVLEWVWDGYEASNGLDFTQLTDGKHLKVVPGSPVPFVGVRVLRGGSFVDDPRNLRSAFRVTDEPSLRHWFIGFRCVRAARPHP